MQIEMLPSGRPLLHAVCELGTNPPETSSYCTSTPLSYLVSTHPSLCCCGVNAPVGATVAQQDQVLIGASMLLKVLGAS